MPVPIVAVFQELAVPVTVPTIPDLNTVIVGPAYDLLDYPDDAAQILLTSTYGSLEQPAGGGSVYVPPVTGTDAVTVLDGAYPAQTVGSVVDVDSVALTFRFPHVVLASTYAISGSTTLGANITTSASDQTLITITAAVTNSFVAAYVRPGDRIILTSSAGTQTVVRTVASVGEPNAAGLIESGNESKLRVSENLPAAGAGVTEWTYNSTGECRIERELPIQAFLDSTHTIITFPEPGTAKLVLKGGVVLPVALTPAATVAAPTPSTVTANRPLSYTQIYLAYRALRQDLQQVEVYDTNDVRTVNSVPTIVGIGKIDARNPLAVAVDIAIKNSGTSPVYAYGVMSNDATGYTAARSAMSTREDLYAFVPLTTDLDIHAQFKTEFVAASDPNEAIDHGVAQQFRMALGNLPLPAAETIYEGSIGGVTVAVSGAVTGLFRTLNIDDTSTGDVNVRDVLPGDTVTIGLTPSASAWQNRRGSHKVAHVNKSADYPTSGDDSIIEIIPGTSRWDSAAGATSGDIELVITAPDGTVKVSNLSAATVIVNVGEIDYQMIVPTLVGGPYTISYAIDAAVASPTVTLSGFDIVVTVDGTTHTTTQVAAAVNAHATVSTLLTATVAASGSAVVNAADGPNAIEPVVGSVTSTIVVNDALFNQLTDASASFLTAQVQANDVIEIPVDPNNYLSDAYDGPLLSYRVATVQSENALLIANGLDDTATAANELPHFFARNLQDRYIDNTAPNAQNYRIRRLLSKDEQVLTMIGQAQSVRSKRLVLTFPDSVKVSDLRDGSLPRSTATERALAGFQPGYYIAAQVGGAMAGLPAQHGLTNLGLNGISQLQHSDDYFTARQLAQLSEGGFFIMVNPVPGALPYCLHQLTTDPTGLQSGELSVVKNVDFLSRFFLDLLKPFIGVYNNIPESRNEIFQAVRNGAENLQGRTIARIGPPLLSGEVTAISPSDIDPSRVDVYFTGVIPFPINTIAFHLVV